MTFSIYPSATISIASIKSAFATVLRSVLAAYFKRSTDELEGIPGKVMEMEKALWLKGPDGVQKLCWVVRLKDMPTQREEGPASVSYSLPIHSCSFSLSSQRITLSAHTLDQGSPAC